MTNKEAIEMLTAKAECMRREVSGKGIIDCDFRSCDECELCYAQGTTAEQIEAIRMAISALEKQDVPNANTDTISRQYAIDAVEKESQVDGAYGYMDTKSIVDLLNGLPSTQPKHNKKTMPKQPDLDTLGIKTGETCKDTISRTAAIDALMERDPNCGIDSAKVIKALPSAQPETAKRIVGKSRDGMTLWYQCDMCNEPVDAQDDFCRGCGRRLTDG